VQAALSHAKRSNLPATVTLLPALAPQCILSELPRLSYLRRKWQNQKQNPHKKQKNSQEMQEGGFGPTFDKDRDKWLTRLLNHLLKKKKIQVSREQRTVICPWSCFEFL
jgi:hypothetical protein